MQLHVEREGGSPRRRRRPADGEVGAVAEVRAQRLEIRAQMRRAQALTCVMPSTNVSESSRQKNMIFFAGKKNDTAHQ